MREIRFRGRDKINSEWIYGDLMHPHMQTDCEWMIIPVESILSDAKFVDPQTIGQYTGLEDKYGIPIFEGDILRMDTFNPDVCEVRFIEGAFCLQFPSAQYPADIHYIHHADRPQATVIGNIYDNPELLEVKS